MWVGAWWGSGAVNEDGGDGEDGSGVVGWVDQWGVESLGSEDGE